MQTARAAKTFDFLSFEALSRKQIASRVTFLGMMLLTLVTLVISIIEPMGLIMRKRLILSTLRSLGDRFQLLVM